MMQTDREYAEALFELAAEDGKTDEYLQCLATVKELVNEAPDYTEFLASPAIPLAERLDAIEEAFGGMPEYVLSFLKLLCENGHIRSLCGCIDEYGKLVMALSDRAAATVYSAVSLNDSQKSAVCVKLKKLIGKDIDPMYVIDKSLIGGIKIETEGKVYDGSIKRRLLDVKDVIIG